MINKPTVAIGGKVIGTIESFSLETADLFRINPVTKVPPAFSLGELSFGLEGNTGEFLRLVEPPLPDVTLEFGGKQYHGKLVGYRTDLSKEASLTVEFPRSEFERK